MSMALMLVVGAASGVSADNGFVIPIDTLVVAEPGSITVLAEEPTPPELIGAACVGVAVAANGPSIHPNNDLIIETGDTVAVLLDVEAESGKITDAVGEVTLGDTVKVSLQMGGDGIFSGGVTVLIDSNCTPPTTVPPPLPAIEIDKTATPEFYGADGIGIFTIVVTNPGPLDLVEVVVTDDDAIAIDPNSDCPRAIGDLAVGDSVTYQCSIAGLDGVSPYDNEATAVGKGPNGNEVTATDNATVFPPVENTTITSPPTTEAPPTTDTLPPTTQAPGTTEAPDETLPVTGIDGGQAQGFGLAGVALLMMGIVFLGGAALIGQYRSES
jgi:hypothetical protein